MNYIYLTNFKQCLCKLQLQYDLVCHSVNVKAENWQPKNCVPNSKCFNLDYLLIPTLYTIYNCKSQQNNKIHEHDKYEQLTQS